MTYRILVAAIAGAVVVVQGCGGTAEASFAEPNLDAIQKSEVVRIVTELTTDEMMGRAAFTPGAEMAAAYLVDEFAASGIEPLPGASGFLQSFGVYSVSPSDVAVTLDGTAVPRDRLLVWTNAESVNWSTGDVPVVAVEPGGNATQSVLGAIRGRERGLVLMGTEHRDAFNAMAAGFLSRPTRTTELGNRGTVVVVLVDGALNPEAIYEVTVTSDVTEEPLANVVGHIPGRRSDEFVLFSAHYDHIGIRPAVEGDSIANGANDNASGTTAVVTLAKYFAARGTPERTIVFAAFTAEESGGYGARHFSQQLDPDQIVAMFNIEMIGKPAVEGPNTAWITGFDRSSFGTLLQEAVEGTEFAFYPDPYPDQNLFYRSDNATLARLGVPAHSISTTPIDVDPDYHQVSDHVETLDLDHMTAAIRAIAVGAETIISGVATPTRVDPTMLN